MTFEAWHICDSNLECHTNRPKIMQLWLKIILIPSSIAICERIFQTIWNQKPLTQEVELEDP